MSLFGQLALERLRHLSKLKKLINQFVIGWPKTSQEKPLKKSEFYMVALSLRQTLVFLSLSLMLMVSSLVELPLKRVLSRLWQLAMTIVNE